MRTLPFTYRMALETGLTRRGVESAVRRGELHRLRRGVFVWELPADHRDRYAQRVSAALLTNPDSVAIGLSALALHNLPNPTRMPWADMPVTLCAPRVTTRYRSNSQFHRRAVESVTTAWGRAASLSIVAQDASSSLPFPQALIVTDAIARRIAATRNRRELAAESTRLRVLHVLGDPSKPAIAHANPAAESPQESISRGHLIMAKVPILGVGTPVRGASGSEYYADLLLDEHTIAEVDGAEKYVEPRDLIREKVRQDDLDAADYVFARWLGSVAWNTPHEVVRRAREALLRTRRRPSA